MPQAVSLIKKPGIKLQNASLGPLVRNKSNSLIWVFLEARNRSVPLLVSFVFSNATVTHSSYFQLALTL